MAQRPHELVQRERAALAAGAGGQPGSVHERRVRHGAQTRSSRPRRARPRARRDAARSPRCSTCRPVSASRSRSARPAQPHVGAPRGRGVAVVDDHQRALGRRRATAPPKPSRSSSRGWVVSGSSRQITTTRERSRISPSVAVDAPRSGNAGAPGHAPATAPVRDERAEPVGERDRGPRVLDGGRRRTRGRSGRRAPRSSSAARASAVSTSAGSPPTVGRRARLGRRTRSENHCGAERAARAQADASPERSTVTSSHSRPQPAQVTAELRHGRAPRRGARTAAAPRARRARGRRRSPRSACTPARPA